MKKDQGTRQRENTTKETTLYMAFELSNSKWKLASSNGSKKRMKTIDARDLEQLKDEIKVAKVRLKLPDNVKILTCYEAGRDGFWLHRYLLSCGIDNVVVDSSSLEVNRRKRRVKTDRVDAKKLLRMLMRYHGGESGLWSVVNVPSEEAEDGRNLNRELEVLSKERTMHRNRIKGLLIQQGIDVKDPSNMKFRGQLDSFRTWGVLGKAGVVLRVKVLSDQSLASRSGASLAGVMVTWGLKRRQWSCGVWD